MVAHMTSIGMEGLGRNGTPRQMEKQAIRAMHEPQRRDRARREVTAIGDRWSHLLGCFADGAEVVPEAIAPELVPVVADEETGYLFRMATLLWSVPVSRGFGRRIRFLVRDRSNGKLVGILAIGDPVFNLRARDGWIGWTVDDRRSRLVNVMDAYVVGAVPPYSQILGGKLVGSLIGAREISTEFSSRYGGRQGIISQTVKDAKLVLVTVTSALGRSSIYNRLRLPGLVEWQRIGRTEGWGHFQVPDSVFDDMRALLAADGHAYACGHQYGDGPNWRMRVIRVALEQIGLNPDLLLRHGVAREVFAMPLAEKWREFLQGRSRKCAIRRPSAEVIGRACLERWVIPRADRRPEFRTWTRSDSEKLLRAAVE